MRNEIAEQQNNGAAVNRAFMPSILSANSECIHCIN